MSYLWVVLACLGVVSVANASLAGVIANQLKSNEIFKTIALNDVPVILDKTNRYFTAKLAKGTVTYTDQRVTGVSRKGSTELMFTVTGVASCIFVDYTVLDEKVNAKWTSKSNTNKNYFKVKLGVTNCVVTSASVESVTMAGINSCTTCTVKDGPTLSNNMMNRIGEQVEYEAKIKTNAAIKAAVSSLNLKGSGFAKC